MAGAACRVARRTACRLLFAFCSRHSLSHCSLLVVERSFSACCRLSDLSVGVRDNACHITPRQRMSSARACLFYLFTMCILYIVGFPPPPLPPLQRVAGERRRRAGRPMNYRRRPMHAHPIYMFCRSKVHVAGAGNATYLPCPGFFLGGCFATRLSMVLI
jgi:hypothetical protein